MNRSTIFAIVALMIGAPFFWSATSPNQSGSGQTKFAQFIITNVQDWDEATHIDEFMRQQAGIEMSRADVPSKRYFCLFDANANITQTTFTTWFNDMGFQVDCYHDGVYGQDPLPNHTYKDCQ